MSLDSVWVGSARPALSPTTLARPPPLAPPPPSPPSPLRHLHRCSDSPKPPRRTSRPRSACPSPRAPERASAAVTAATPPLRSQPPFPLPPALHPALCGAQRPAPRAPDFPSHRPGPARPGRAARPLKRLLCACVSRGGCVLPDKCRLRVGAYSSNGARPVRGSRDRAACRPWRPTYRRARAACVHVRPEWERRDWQVLDALGPGRSQISESNLRLMPSNPVC
jgi:hypothetical protein